ncbi:MAG: PhoH family protein, partial [Halanaerobium sp.]|nr:PhoH family protein [Halanaerobium sp.]
MREEVITVENNDLAFSLLGQKDRNLKIIEDTFSVQIMARGNRIKITGEDDKVGKVTDLIKELIKVLRENKHLTPREIEYAARMARSGNIPDLKAIYDDVIQVSFRGKQIKPKTLGQKVYVDAIRKNDIVFGIGPAGTGKTYLAMVMAVRSYVTKKISRIILTRPAIEAGEKLGFLPGDLQDKVDPYLRPLYDALY